jgi:hypothetical protein
MNGRSPAVRILFTCFVPKTALFCANNGRQSAFFWAGAENSARIGLVCASRGTNKANHGSIRQHRMNFRQMSAIGGPICANRGTACPSCEIIGLTP